MMVKDALRKLSNELSFARYVYRFLGFIPALEAAQTGSWTWKTTKTETTAQTQTLTTVHKWLGRIMAWSMVAYYPLEYGAYLQWKVPELSKSLWHSNLITTTSNSKSSPLPSPQPSSSSSSSSSLQWTAEKLSAYSCRFWLAYIVADILQAYLKLREERQLLWNQARMKKTDGDDHHDYHDNDNDNDQQRVTGGKNAEPRTSTDGGKAVSLSSSSSSSSSVSYPSLSSAKTLHLQLQILRGVLYTLPAIHWSLPNWDRDPWLSEPIVNGLMSLEALVCMYQSIKDFSSPKTS